MSEVYRTILADPAWLYNDKLRQSDTLRSSEDQYKSVMTVEEICGLWSRETQLLAGFTIAKDAFLFLWTTNPMLLDGSAVTVCRSWGFTQKQLVTWVKGRLALDSAVTDVNHNGQPVWERTPKLVLQTGMGHITRGVTEQLIVATKGSPIKLVQHHGTNNVILEEEDTLLLEKRGVHSKKPQAMYELIERVVPGPYLELFARKERPGWTAWGNELHAK